MSTKTILIISEFPADFYSLGAALDRAEPERFKSVTVSTRDQPVDALMDPGNDAVILAYTPETEYLLRLAQKKHLTLPIIVLIDQESEDRVGKLKAAGASDYIVRGVISDDLLHRILDYSIMLSSVRLQHEHVLQQQRIEHAVQQGGEHLRSVAHAGGDGRTFHQPGLPPSFTVITDDTTEKPQPAVTVLAQSVPRGLSTPWKATILVLLVAVALVSVGLLDQRLDSEARLSRLEAGNDILSGQLLQIHSELTRIALAPTPVVVTGSDDVTEPEPELAVTADPTFGPKPEPTPIVAIPQTTVTVVGGENWFINLGTFSSNTAAQRFADGLRPSAHQIEVQSAIVAGQNLYRVRLINLPSEEVAYTLATDYQLSLGGNPLWVGRY